MSCETCEDLRKKDGAIPDCETEEGCVIPELPPDGKRILGIREKIIQLKDLVGPEVVLKMYQARLGDLNLLAFAENEYRAVQPKPKEDPNDRQ